MDLKRKLSSRKLWACLLGVAFGISVAFGVDGDTITQVAGAVTSLVSIVTYVITEGKIDAAAVNQAYEDADIIIDAVAEALADEYSESEAEAEIEAE